MNNNANILNDTLLHRFMNTFINYYNDFHNDEEGKNNKYTKIKQLRYNFLLRIDYHYIDNSNYEDLILSYEMLVNLLGDKNLNKVSWNLILNKLNIDIDEYKLEQISIFFNNEYVEHYIENMYKLWQLLFRLDIYSQILVFSIFIIFGFSYFYSKLLEEYDKKDCFLLLFIIKLLKKNYYSDTRASFLLFVKDLLQENKHQLARYFTFEEDLVFNIKSKVSQRALYVLMSYGGYAENREIRTHIPNASQSVNRLFNSIMQIDSHIVSIEKVIKAEEPNLTYNYFKSEFIQNFLLKGIE